MLTDVNSRVQMMRFRAQPRPLFAFQFLIRPGFVMKARTSMGVPFQ
ncbi:MAG: hypothetical protein QOD47_687 [Gemmatimonadaceae bacterium]|jgi:hypothetical protein|nr:hypothetical protein [Gemmatimonadaceae bacterium]